VHRDGDWHGALHIWVGGLDQRGCAFVLLQRRSATKDTWPGALDVAVGGHVRSGETLADTAREAEEEIGLAVPAGSLVRLGRRFAHGTTPPDNEVQEVFGLRSDLPLAAYRLHPDEVDEVIRLPLDGALALFEGRAATARGVALSRDDTEHRPVTVAVDDFAAAARDGYPARALQALGEVIAGRVPDPFELR
jgi:8-oxo-dGTP pyrophosphatase MutT (NUDIX family)